MKRGALKNWYMLLNDKLREHFRFAKRRRFTVFSKVFDSLLLHKKRNKAYKKNMNKLLVTRAKSLLLKAFKFGLKKNWRKMVMEKKLAKASEIYCKFRQMRPSFKALKRRWTINSKNYKEIK